jgi:hypothetical protein
MSRSLRAGDPPDAVGRLAKALFALDAMVDARSTLVRAEPRTDPDTVWRAARLLQSRAQMIATLLEPFLYDEQSLWEAIHWIRDAD